MKISKEEKAQAIKELKKIIKPTSTIGINITHVSQSGMSRRMRVITTGLRDITWYVGVVCDLPRNDKGVLVSGCGMDMAFWLANHLTYYLYGNKPKKAFKGNGGGCIAWKVI